MCEPVVNLLVPFAPLDVDFSTVMSFEGQLRSREIAVEIGDKQKQKEAGEGINVCYYS